MNYLAIDTSGDLIVILKANGKRIVKNLKGCIAKHSLTLMPYIEEALQEANITINDLDFISAVVGPGSFTGIRIGVATVKALCFACNKKALSLTSFDVLAYADNAPENCLCLIDANHGNYYCAGYTDGKVTLSPCFLTTEQVKEQLQNKTVCSKDDLPFENNFVCDLVSGLERATEEKAHLIADSEELVPLYVKRSQAEEEFC